MNKGFWSSAKKIVFILCLFCMAGAEPCLHAQTPKIEGGVATLVQARQALSKAVGTDSFSLWLDSYALALPLGDALTLYGEFIPKAPAGKRAGHAVNAAAFASLAGRWEDAATFYAYSPVNAELLLKSARCWLAAGKPGKAREQLDRIDATSANSPGIASQKNLALAWTCILDGEEEKAFVLLQGLVGKGNGSSGGTKSAESSKTSQEGAEALFLLWVIANSADFSSFKVPTKGFDAKSLETWLAEEYPESTELSLIKRQLALLPGNLLLEGFYGSGKNVPVAEKSLATAKASGEAASGRQNGPVQLQVGYFSRKENAQAVFSSLQKKGFQVTIEEQKSSDGQLRWAVIVSSEGDWTKTQAKLKDLGYESYLLP